MDGFGWQDCLATGPGSAILGSLLFSALFPAPMSVKFLLRVAGTLLLAWAAAAACVALHTPLPWMLGPLVATSVLSMAGAPTESWGPLRNGGQWAIGAALGLYFTPEVSAPSRPSFRLTAKGTPCAWAESGRGILLTTCNSTCPLTWPRPPACPDSTPPP